MKLSGLIPALVLVLAHSSAAQDVPVAATSPPLLEIADPILEGIDPAVAQQIGEQWTRVHELKSNPDVPPMELAAAYGSLGELFFLYEMLAPSEPAFLNARDLMPNFHRWHYFLGVVTQEQRRLDEARKHFMRVLEFDAGYLSALVRLGEVETAAGRPEEAEAWYRRALEVDPQSAAAHLGLGQLAYGEKESAKAVEHFEAALEIQPEATAVHYPLALAYRDLGDRDMAREHIALRGDRAVGKQDPLVDGLSQRVAGSSLYMKTGNRAFSRQNWELAVQAYGKAVEADPENAAARHAYGTALLSAGESQKAREQLEWVVENDPDDSLVHYNLGTLYSQLRVLEKAMHHLRRAVELAPDLAAAHLNLGLLLEQEGDAEGALEAYRIVRELDPQNTAAIIRHAVLSAQVGRQDEAEADLRAVLAVNPRDSNAQLALGRVLGMAGRAPEALEQYALAAAETTEDRQARARAHFAAGQLELDRNRIEAAIDQLQSTVDLMPGIAEARGLLAIALRRGGYLTEAAAQYDIIIRQSVDYRPAHYGRVMALLLGRRDAEAVASAESSLQALPDEVELAHLLARILATSEDSAVRNGERALQIAKQVMQREQTLHRAETIAMALAELGRFEDAAALQSQLRQRAEALPGAPLVSIEAHLASYQRGEPVRAPWFDAD